MKCFECEKGKLISKDAEVMGEVRGEKFVIRTEAMVCDHCGAQVLTDKQSSAYTIAIADAYRQVHGLLTSADLKRIRTQLGLSLRRFAAYVGVSFPSVKRWEAGLIQDEAHDRLIRLRADLETAQKNVTELQVLLGLKSSSTPQMIDVAVKQSAEAPPEWQIADDIIAGVKVAPGFMRDTCYSA